MISIVLFPVSRFCEALEIPCLFPGADLPDARAGDFYTLYFSRGLKLEADLIAAHLAAHPASGVVQAFCDASEAGAAASLRQTLAARGQSTSDLQLDCDKPLPPAGLAARLATNPDAAAVLWLRPPQLNDLENPPPAGRIYVSSTLLDNRSVDSLRAAPGPVFEAYAFKLPGESDPALQRFLAWAKARKIELTTPRRQAEAYFSCMALGYTVKHMRRFFMRDYALDMLEHSPGLAIYRPYHPRPTFGPDQRFLNKGGYVLPVVNGKPEATNAEWILP